MASRIFLHIGVPKSGTTYIQTIMWANRRLLKQQNFLFPGVERHDHFQAFQQLRNANQDGPRAGAWTRLVAELGAWDHDGLVSHEFFCMASPAQARRVVDELSPAEIHVVMTCRSLCMQFSALWQEALKMNYDGGFDQFMDEAFVGERPGAWGWSSQDLPSILDTWETVVPRERIHIVTVPPPGSPRDLLWKRWTETIGIDDSRFDLDVSYPNESLGAAQAALLRHVRPYLSGPLEGGTGRHRWVRRYFGHEVLVPQGGTRFYAGPEYQAELRQRARTSIETLRERGYDVHGDLEDIAVDCPPSDGPHPDHVSDAEIVEVAARAIEQMIRDVRWMTLDRNKWRDLAQARGARRPLRQARDLVQRVRRRIRP